MPNGLTGLDHVIVGVRDLERARDRWSRLGFALSPRGHHIGQSTANYCIMFASDYIELLGLAETPAPASEPPTGESRAGAQHLDAFLARCEGLMAVAFAPSGTAEEARAALLQLRLHPSEPRPLGRHLELPEGTAVPRFSLVSLPAEETPGLDCFVCGHLTPELMRRPEWLTHSNGAIGLKGIHVLVDDTAALLPAYDRLFGLPDVTTTDAVVSILVGRQRILFSTPDDFMAMHPTVDLDPRFLLPGIVALELLVLQRTATADFLVRQQIPFIDMPDGSLVVPASEANGAALFFAER